MELIKILFSYPYEQQKELCHLLKAGDKQAIRRAASLLNGSVPEHCVLIPVPGHNGDAGYTLDMVRSIHDSLDELGPFAPMDVQICDCLMRTPGESLCEKKRRGETVHFSDVSIYYKSRRMEKLMQAYLADGYVPVLVDNVVDTGTTVMACNRVKGLNNAAVIALGATGNHIIHKRIQNNDKPDRTEVTTNMFDLFGKINSVNPDTEDFTVESATNNAGQKFYVLKIFAKPKHHAKAPRTRA